MTFVRKTLKDIGYTKAAYGIEHETCAVLAHIEEQSPEIAALVHKHFPLKPADIIKELDLRRPIYKKTAVYGHFGRDEPGFTWERIDKVDILKKEAGS